MGREIRRVPWAWKHPVNPHTGRYVPLLGYTHAEAVAAEGDEATPPELHFPEWPEGTRLAYQLYETISEGTPKSPKFATEDELREYLYRNPEWGATMSWPRAYVDRLMDQGSMPSAILHRKKGRLA